MRILLVAMPESVDMFDNFCRLPNLAIVSLAGNLRNHEVKTLDLIIHKPHIRSIIEDALHGFRPYLVGLSAMTFQFDSLLRIAAFIHERYPEIKIAAGGYHVSLLAQGLTNENKDMPIDFIIRGEGETTFRELADRLDQNPSNLNDIDGLSYKQEDKWVHNPDRHLSDLSSIELPLRQSRISNGFHIMGVPADVVETSRGCVFGCKFCSITQMYGSSFRMYPVERIIADLKTIRSNGSKTVFFVDDNITYNAGHFSRVCQAITNHRLNDMWYMIQASAIGIANHPDLVADMSRANFRVVFVGFESMESSTLRGVKKPTNPATNLKAARLLREHDIAIIAGMIAGYPDDDTKTIRLNFRLVRGLKPVSIIAQFMTPYPKTVMREEMLSSGLIVNRDDFSCYDGFTCNIKTHYLSQKELYRCVRLEMLKSYFSPSMIVNNYFLKNYPLFYLKAEMKTFILRLCNLFKGKEKNRRMDI